MCYTPFGSSNSSVSDDCGDISFVYDKINSVTIRPKFHFIAFEGNQFSCNNSNDDYNANLFVENLISNINLILGNFDANSNGGSQLPNNGESKVRFLSGSDIFACPNIEFWNSSAEFDAQITNLDPNFYHIVFNEKAKNNNGVITYGSAGTSSTIGMYLHNIHHAIFTEGASYESVGYDYDGIAVHELFHTFGLSHIWLCVASCADLDPYIECGTSPGGSEEPCGSSCEDANSNGVWNNSNNTMGYNPHQNALSNCQWAQAYDGIVEEKLWKTVNYNQEYSCSDIVIDHSYAHTTVWECDKELDCDIIIESGRELILKNITVKMGLGTSIVLHPGSRLILEGAEVRGSQATPGIWEGIKILNGDGSSQYYDPYFDIHYYSTTKAGTLVLKLNENNGVSKIKHANVGVHVGVGGLLNFNFAKIVECNLGVEFVKYAHYNKSSFNTVGFDNNRDFIIKGNFGFFIDSPRFTSEFSDNNSYGLILHNSTIDNLLSPYFSGKKVGIALYGSSPFQPGFTLGDENSGGWLTRFTGCEYGVFLGTLGFGTSQNMIIKDSNFSDCNYGIVTLGESEYNIFNNEFTLIPENGRSIISFSSGQGTNDCYCNDVNNTASTSGGFSFVSDNSNTSIYANSFDFSSPPDLCIETLWDGNVFGIQATNFDPAENLFQNNRPAANSFKLYTNDLLIDELGDEIIYLTPQDVALTEFIPTFESNYTNFQSFLNPNTCSEIVAQFSEPNILVPSDFLPPSVKQDWPNPIGNPLLLGDYIEYLIALDPGSITEEARELEVSRAEFTLYNAITAITDSPNAISILDQLKGNIWKRIKYGILFERGDFLEARQLINIMVPIKEVDHDFIFIQDIILDKIDHELNLQQLPFGISTTDKQDVIDIIQKGNIISGYASSLYFDIFGEILVPSLDHKATPRRSNIDLSKEKGNSFYVYPNPASEILYIHGHKVSELVKVYNIYRNEILNIQLGANRSIDISALEKGVYFIMTESRDIQKFIKI